MKTHPTGDELKALIGRPDPVILDIGCNDGEHTLLFRQLFPDAWIYCFEPDTRAAARFCQTGNDPAMLYEFALSDRDGEIEFYPSTGFPNAEWESSVPGGWDRSGSIRKPKQHLEIWPWCKFGAPVKVKTQRLDTWTNEHDVSRIDLIWADVQGAEIDLIKGGAQTLKNTRYFFTEYNEMELYEGQAGLREIFDLLQNFSIIGLYAGWNAMFRNESERA